MKPDLHQRTTTLLRRFADGEAAAADELLPLLYEELRAIARRLLADQRSATLQPTELIHEAWLRLAGPGAAERYDDRLHFRRVAAKAMRYVVVDRARARSADKRGGGERPATLDEAHVAAHVEAANDVLAVHEGLQALAGVDAQLAELVELRFYGGLTMDEVAEILGMSRRSAQRAWQLARAWWLQEYGERSEP